MADSNDFVKWGKRYLTNIPLIDEQHQELIRITNELYRECRKGSAIARSSYKNTLKDIVDYVVIHFSTEEKMMEIVKYPELMAHKNQHEGFVKKILEDTKNFQEGKTFVPNVFVRYLRDWIFSHIAIEDKHYADYIFSLKKQGLLEGVFSSSKARRRAAD
ncbi:MAG: bacteriohemerythrin [Treponema sp.]|jgi:hemerythrin|nr:bacteriohemerythrin [Treponema sp.]